LLNEKPSCMELMEYLPWPVRTAVLRSIDPYVNRLVTWLEPASSEPPRLCHQTESACIGLASLAEAEIDVCRVMGTIE
jgi:hypothetical protein